MTAARAAAARAPGAWVIHCDGSAWPNPGRMGLGAVLTGPDGTVHHRISEATGITGCNNEAELLALGRALELALAAGARHLVVKGDSDFAVRHLRGEAHTAVPRLVGLIDGTRALLARFRSVRLEWVPRHRNPDADRLSRAAIGLPDKPPLRPVSRRRRR